MPNRVDWVRTSRLVGRVLTNPSHETVALERRPGHMDVPRRIRGENRAKTTFFALFTGVVTGSPIARFILAPPHRTGAVIEMHDVLGGAVGAAPGESGTIQRLDQ